MTREAHRPSLVFNLSEDLLRGLVQKPLFGGQFIRLTHSFVAGLFLYETGAVLGWSRRDRLEVLAKMFSEPGREEDIAAFLRQAAAERIDKYGKEPDSFVELFLATEYKRVGIQWPPNDRDAMELYEAKVPIEDVDAEFQMYFLEGIALGAAFPELTERIWTYEMIDIELWARARRQGLKLSKQPRTPVTLEERAREVLVEVAQYVTEYFPELVEPLGLRLAERG